MEYFAKTDNYNRREMFNAVAKGADVLPFMKDKKTNSFNITFKVIVKKFNVYLIIK